MVKTEIQGQVVRYIFLFVCFFCLFVGQSQEKADFTIADREAYYKYIEYITPYSQEPLGEVIIKSAKFFLNIPYVASTLEKEPERLVVNLRELDCTTFVETVLALSRTVKQPIASFESFLNNLEYIRYKDGCILDYTSRLHYMSEWIYDNEKAGVIKDVTHEIGGIPFPVNLSFMTQHPTSYRQLANNPELLTKLRKIEEEVNQRDDDTYYYIPKQEAKKVLYKLQNGDIVLFTTSIDGLDVTHVGFIYKQKSETTFIHASTSAKKVVINEAPLVDYMNRIKSNTGMIILRPQPIS